MLHALSLHINKIQELINDPTTYRELDSDLNQTIRNDVLTRSDFLHSFHLVDHRTRNHLTP